MSRVFTLLCVLTVLAVLPLPAQIQDAEAPPVTESIPTTTVDPQPEAQAVSSGLPERAPQARTMRAYWHVFIAFGVTWLLLFGYALTVGRRFGRLEEEVHRLASSDVRSGP
jgi:CcmD family protein